MQMLRSELGSRLERTDFKNWCIEEIAQSVQRVYALRAFRGYKQNPGIC